jgi:hypothetical protein
MLPQSYVWEQILSVYRIVLYSQVEANSQYFISLFLQQLDFDAVPRWEHWKECILPSK